MSATVFTAVSLAYQNNKEMKTDPEEPGKKQRQ